MKICVLGLGYIGLPTALLLAQNHEVRGVDVNRKIIDSLNHGDLPFEEPGLKELFIATSKNFSACLQAEQADVFIIAVPTPLNSSIRVSDLSYVRSAAEMIVPYLKEGNLVILESTVPPGTSEKLVIPILENSGVKRGDFLMVHCPERAIPGNTLHEMIHNDRIIGGFNQISQENAVKLYKSFVKGNLLTTDLRTAEFAKLMENTYRDVNIAIANEFALLSEELGINVWETIELANRHPRVNILQPGPGVGGHCIAIDPWFLTEGSHSHRMISLARDINDSMPKHVVTRIRDIVSGIYKPIITIMGVAYKGNVDDARETPALKIIKLCENEGFTVRVFDPHVHSFEYPLSDFSMAVSNSDLLVITTDHNEFRDLIPTDIGKMMKNKNILDCRNLIKQQLWKNAGFNVYLLGNSR